MITRLGRSEFADKGKLSSVDSTRIAAKAADIKLFDNLVRDLKRANERVIANRNDEKNADPDRFIRNEYPVCVQEVCPLFGDRHRTDTQMLNTEQDRNTKQADPVRISVDCTDHIYSTAGALRNNIGRILSVIERIIINHQNSKQPGHWQISIELGDSEPFDLTLDYLGKDDWELALGPDAGDPKNNGYKYLCDELAIHLEKKLKAGRLNLSVIPQIRRTGMW